MDFRPGLAGGAVVAAWLTAAAPTAVHATIQLHGATSATFEWEPSSGPVAGYYVIVSRNGGAAGVQTISADNRETLEANLGDVVVVQVAPFDSTGVAGPLSTASEPVEFLPEDGGGGGGDPPPDGGGSDGGGGDPPPDGGGGAGQEAGSGVPLDFDGDGFSDLLVRDAPSGSLMLWSMQAGEMLGSHAVAHLSPEWQIAGHGDYDGDGYPDILWHQPDALGLIVWNVRDGVVAGGGSVDLSSLDDQWTWTVGGSADFDADGRDDVLMINRQLGVAEVLHLDREVVLARTRFDSHHGPWSVVGTGDTDLDGIAEIVWRNEIEHSIELWKLSASGAVTVHPLGTSLDGWRVAGAADFDGDQRLDLLLEHVATASLETWFLEGERVASVMTLPSGNRGSWRVFGGGDYDGNDMADLVWVDPESGQVELWLSTATAVQTALVTVQLAGDASVASGNDGSTDAAFFERLCDGDFNDDGIVGGPDLALLRRCLGEPAVGECESIDMNSDGGVSSDDYLLFREQFGGPSCAVGG